jgi:large subunit ribosomal protein L17
MRHLVSGRKLNRTASHRKAMLSNLATSLLDKERVATTLAKAKEVRGVVERQITYGKRGTLHAIRLAAKTVKDKTVLKKLFDEIAPGYKEREGGYTRIVKTGERNGDNAPMCIIELVGRNSDDIQRKRKKSGAGKKTKTAPAAAKAPVAEKSSDVNEAVESKE